MLRCACTALFYLLFFLYSYARSCLYSPHHKCIPSLLLSINSSANVLTALTSARTKQSMPRKSATIMNGNQTGMAATRTPARPMRNASLMSARCDAQAAQERKHAASMIIPAAPAAAALVAAAVAAVAAVAVAPAAVVAKERSARRIAVSAEFSSRRRRLTTWSSATVVLAARRSV